MTPPSPISPDLLLHHAAFLRRLAQRLVGDEAGAEDVLQETWVVALEHPPKRRTSLRAWLASVTRNLALQRLRSERRRRDREERSARSEALASTIDLAEREAMLRAVVEGVFELPERQREAVLLRDFEGLPPREIAARLDIPVDTVKTRLKRARQNLRAHLEAEWGREDERGSWTRALVIAAGVRIDGTGELLLPSPGKQETGAIPMSLQLTAATSILGALTATGIFLSGQEGEAATPAFTTNEQAEAPKAEVLQEPEQRVPAADDPVAVAVGSDAAVGTGVPALVTFELELEFVDLEGQPLQGYHLLGAPKGHALNRLCRLDGDGRARLRWQDERAITHATRCHSVV